MRKIVQRESGYNAGLLSWADRARRHLHAKISPFIDCHLDAAPLLCIARPNDLRRLRQPVGIFEGHSDVGTVLHPGSVDYDAS